MKKSSPKGEPGPKKSSGATKKSTPKKKSDPKKSSGPKKKRFDRVAIEREMIFALIARKESYEAYFKQTSKMDHKAESAFTSIIKAILELVRKQPEEQKKQDPEEMDRVAKEILQSEYGIRR